MGAATMITKRLITTGALTSIFVAKAWGSVFFTVDVGSLQDENGTALVDKGMLYLISSGADGSFSLPTEGSITGAGDDSVVAAWDLSTETSTQGEYIVSSGKIAYDETWALGDDLAILWFPNLAVSNQSPAASEAYGFYRNTSVSGGGDVWELPEDGTLLHSLKFFTEGDNPLVEGSDVPALLAAAGLGVGESAGPPTAPVKVATNENNPGTIAFEWEGASVPGGAYRIERKLAGVSDWTVLGTVEAGETSFDDPTVGRGKNYEYRLVGINGFDSVASSEASIQSLQSSLANIATRGVLKSGAEALILGFVIKGTGQIDILATAKGPELANVGITNFALDPTIALFPFGATAPDVENDDWGNTQLTEINDFVGRSFATNFTDQSSKDAALAFSPEGTQLFTAIVNDSGNADGVGLVEVFDATGTSRNGVAPNDAQNRLVNVATRGFVGTGDEVLIAGFIVDGQVDSKLLLRGLGPSIAGLTGTVEDPTITLFRTDFTQPGFPQIEVATNDNWEDDASKVDEIIATSRQVGAAVLDSGSKDSIILIDAVPGLYSFVMSGVSDGTGIGLVEVFLAD